MSGFHGFPPAAWQFLDRLAGDNTAANFARQRDTYQSAIAVPSRALVEALVPRLASDVHPALTGEAKVGRSLFRINRDTRFATDKTAYKTYVDFLFWAGCGDPRSSAACIIRLTSATVLTGAGRIGLRGADLAAYRKRITDPPDGPRVRAAVDRLVATGQRSATQHGLDRRVHSLLSPSTPTSCAATDSTSLESNHIRR